MTPDKILASIYEDVSQTLDQSAINAPDILQNIETVSRNIRNRAGVRLILACALAKVYDPDIDIRKPYTEIGDRDSFSGRSFDETYVAPFINKYELPCNPTTAFLTPALRNINTVLTPETNLSGRPKEVYVALLRLLDDVHRNRLTAEQLLSETIRQLIVFRDEKRNRMASLIASLDAGQGDTALSAEQIITLIEQHLATRGSSRLPVLIVAAAYQAVEQNLGESLLPLEAHNAADSQTQSLGDLQITLSNEHDVVTCYEMKMRRITRNDIDIAIQKLAKTSYSVDNYIFITTDYIDPVVTDYARILYEQIGIEMVILDCIGFLRHFLHLFHRHRMKFIDAYQALVLAEPESAVSQPLKEVFLALRQAAESN